MRKAWLFAAGLIASGMLITPSLAQVEFGVGPNGPNVRVGPRHDRTYERRYYNEDRVVTGSTRRCRTVTVREEDEDGDMVTRRIRRCD